MQDIEIVNPSSSCRKSRRKTSFRYSTMKELQKAREYKSKKKLVTSDPSIVQKTLKYPTRAQKQQDTEIDEVHEEGYQTPTQCPLVVTLEHHGVSASEDKDINPKDGEIEV
jgi:hypothetical protein